MSFIFNAPKDGAKFATLNPNYDKSGWSWATLAATLEFSELRFTSNDDFYFIFCEATKLTDFKNFEDMKMIWSPQLVTFQVAKKDYEQYKKSEGKKVTVAQSRLEKIVCLLLSELDPAKCYSGELCLMDTSTLDYILSGKDKKGAEMSPEKIAALLETCGTFEEVEAPEKIVDADVGVPAKKSGGGGYGTTVTMQSELEKLNDRMTFISNQFQKSNIAAIQSVAELQEVVTVSPGAMTIYQGCLELMK